MKDPQAVLSVGSIILALMGGIAGNFFVGISERFKKKRPMVDRSDIPDAILLIGFGLFLLYILGTMGYLLVFGNISANPNAFYAVVGILFGVVGSMLANYLVIFWDRHHETRVRDGKWLNRDGWLIVIFGIVLAGYIAYLMSLLSQVN